MSYAERVGKVLDMRNLVKPPLFDGAASNWTEFRFRFENLACLMSIKPMLDQASTATEEQLTALQTRYPEEGTVLYALLTQICSNRAQQVVQHEELGCGWRDRKSVV